MKHCWRLETGEGSDDGSEYVKSRMEARSGMPPAGALKVRQAATRDEKRQPMRGLRGLVPSLSATVAEARSQEVFWVRRRPVRVARRRPWLKSPTEET